MSSGLRPCAARRPIAPRSSGGSAKVASLSCVPENWPACSPQPRSTAPLPPAPPLSALALEPPALELKSSPLLPTEPSARAQPALVLARSPSSAHSPPGQREWARCEQAPASAQEASSAAPPLLEPEPSVRTPLSHLPQRQ